jgi:MoaA/NifB/PqqE/SkfB family radical SAM enzyme
MQVEINSEFLEELTDQILVLDFMRWKYIRTMPAGRSEKDLWEIKKRERLLRNDANLLKSELKKYLETLKNE